MFVRVISEILKMLLPGNDATCSFPIRNTMLVVLKGLESSTAMGSKPVSPNIFGSLAASRIQFIAWE